MEQLHYIVDNNGNRVSAVVPFMVWESIHKKYKRMENKLTTLLGIQESITEIRNACHSGEKLQTLDDFLNENKR